MENAAITHRLRRLPVHNRQEVLVNDQDLNSIIKAIKHYHNLHKNEYDTIAKPFWRGNVYDTAKLLFDFCKEHIKYDVESDSNQTVKSPGRLLKDGHGDCKHYSSFINGVVDSLHRQGYPIDCMYRFVSDVPGKNIHHVFAVVKDGTKQYWVDPVLLTFDKRPPFHNVTDIDFKAVSGIGKLSYLSGTDNDEIGEYDSVGLFKKKPGGSAFKKALQSVKQGVKNTGKKIQHAAQDVKKGAKNTIKKATKLAVKVTLVNARNAFLALVDINFANLAERITTTLKGANGNRLREEWKKLGGNPDKLQSAANNGMRFKGKIHKKAVKGISGMGMCVGMGITLHSRYITSDPKSWSRHQRHIGSAMVGVEPVSTATLLALASSIIAVLSKFLDLKRTEQQIMASGAAEGVMSIADKAAMADGGANLLNYNTAPSSGQDTGMIVEPGIDSEGNPQVTIQDVKHPALTDAGQPNGGAASDVNPYEPGETDTVPFSEDPGQWISDHAGKWVKPVAIGLGIILLGKYVVVPLFNKYKKR